MHAVSGWQDWCQVTKQRYSVARAPKLSGTEKLLPYHSLTPRKSYYYYIILLLYSRFLRPQRLKNAEDFTIGIFVKYV